MQKINKKIKVILLAKEYDMTQPNLGWRAKYLGATPHNFKSFINFAFISVLIIDPSEVHRVKTKLQG